MARSLTRGIRGTRGDGDVTTEEGEIQVLFHGLSSEETNAGSTGLEGGTRAGH